jgi:hypothetical protein
MKTLFMFLAAFASMPAIAQAPLACAAKSGVQRAPLLELYTSEGCSSCPPADRWLAGLAANAAPRSLNLLSFHVDYWDEIGWPDRFASAAYTARQRQRVAAGGSSTIYTPQVMLGSRLDLRWYKPEDVARAIGEAQAQTATVDLQLNASRDGRVIKVDASALPLDVAVVGDLYLALYENGLSSAVKAGENAGRSLHHERVVRGLWGPWPLDAKGAKRSLSITPPASASVAHLGLTAFVQNRRGDTLQSLSLPLPSCAAAATAAR